MNRKTYESLRKADKPNAPRQIILGISNEFKYAGRMLACSNNVDFGVQNSGLCPLGC